APVAGRPDRWGYRGGTVQPLYMKAVRTGAAGHHHVLAVVVGLGIERHQRIAVPDLAADVTIAEERQRARLDLGRDVGLDHELVAVALEAQDGGADRQSVAIDDVVERGSGPGNCRNRSKDWQDRQRHPSYTHGVAIHRILSNWRWQRQMRPAVPDTAAFH